MHFYHIIFSFLADSELDHYNIEQALAMKLKKMYEHYWNGQFLFMSPLKLALQMAKAKENHPTWNFGNTNMFTYNKV